MNHIYRLVWNAVTQAWTAVSETARARGKSGAARQRGLIVLAAVLGATGWNFSSAVVAQTLQLCGGSGSGRSYSYDGSGALNCQRGSDDPWFNLQNRGSNANGGGEDSTVFVRGMRDHTLRLGAQNGIAILNRVDMTNNIIQGVAAGAVNATSTEAINGAQLFSTNTAVNNIQAQTSQNESSIATLNSRVTMA
ncbi:ESPR domain-containing protein, partial [Achromobacter xylosoxidans]